MADERRRSARLRHATRWRGRLLALALTAACVGATLSAAWAVAAAERSGTTARFGRVADRIEGAVVRRLRLQEAVLRSAAGYVAGSEWVTRDEWRTFVAAQDVPGRLQGLRAIVHIVRVPRGELPSFVAQMRREGAPDFAVAPAGDDAGGPDAMVVAYAEPEDAAGELVGQDLATIAATRGALERAPAARGPLVSGPMPRSAGAPGDRSIAMVLATRSAPSGRPDAPPPRDGWVAALLGLRQFLSEATTHEAETGVDVEIFDGETPTWDGMLLDADAHAVAAGAGRWAESYADRPHDALRRIPVGGRTWTLRISATRGWGDPDRPTSARWWVLGLGTAVSALVGATVSALSRTRHLAQRLAEQATSHLERQRRELAEARDAAVAAVRAKSDFLAAVSHEVRTPLHGILGMSRMLVEADLPVEQAEQARTIDLSARALLAILNDVLDVSRIEAGKLVLEAAPFDLRTACEDVLDILVAQAAQKGVELALRWRKGVPTTYVGDALRTKQVLANLVGNAVKYTEHGSVLVDVLAGEAEPRRAAVELRVEDTGVGIPAEKLPLLFRRFSQVDASPARREGGSGLGLRITKLLVEHMGGTVAVDSTPGRGTVFTVRLPLARPSESSRPGPSRRPDGPVLVVDRSPVARAALRESAEGLGCTVLEAEGTDEALAALRRAAAEGLPVGTAVVGATPEAGRPFAAAVRGDPATAGTPLLLASPPAIGSAAEAARAAGFDGWLSKPLRGRDLRAALDRLADGRSEATPFLTRAVLAAGRRGASPSTAPLGGPARQVLLVEDHEVNVLVARRMLEVLGCAVTVARDGAEAVGLTASRPFDLVLMDCRMPGVDGYAATREIRARDGAARRVPIVAMTADASEDDRQRCQAAGMDDFLAKPFDLDALRRVLLRWSPRPPAAPAPTA